jgi:hypothetical protein
MHKMGAENRHGWSFEGHLKRIRGREPERRISLGQNESGELMKLNSIFGWKRREKTVTVSYMV